MIRIVMVVLMAASYAGHGSEKKGKAYKFAREMADRKYPDSRRDVVVRQAKKIYKVRKEGDKVSAMVGGRYVSGTLRAIGVKSVLVGDFKVNKMHFPSHLFDEKKAMSCRKEFVYRNFDKAKADFRMEIYKRMLIRLRKKDKNK